MLLQQLEIANTLLPSPFPEGWYFVASRPEVLKAKLIQKTWMGTNIVAWCDDEGRVCVAESVCPHLGSDLGPAAGGRVRDGRLVCPFHGFEYDGVGQCVATPYAPAPRQARLRVFHTQEVVGLIFGWWGMEGRGPQWDLPTDSVEEAGWSQQEIRTLRFPGHPQETTENSVDLAHLRYVHGYESVARVGEMTVDGPRLESHFNFKNTWKIAKIAKFALDISSKTHVAGLGYSLVEISEHSIGMDMRLWVLATPVDGTLIDLSLVSQTREIRNPKRWFAGLGFLPPRLRAHIMNKIVAPMQTGDVQLDMVIWRRKSYRSQPQLCYSDGEIMPYRAYCAQFYPEAHDSVSPLPVTPEEVAR